MTKAHNSWLCSIWPRFGLRTSLLLVTAFCLWLGLQVHRASEQARAVAAVHELGGVVRYHFEYPRGLDRPLAPNARPPGPRWLRKMIGIEFFTRPILVDLNQTKADNRTLKLLNDMPSLQRIALGSTKITDAGLFHLQAMTSLETLVLENTQITDAGLKHLWNMKSLRSVWLLDTGVSEEGVAALRQALNPDQERALSWIKAAGGHAELVHSVSAGWQLYLYHTNRLPAVRLRGELVSDEVMLNLKGLDMQQLVLASDKVTDAGFQHLGHFTNLRKLVIQSTTMTDAAIASLRHLTKLEILSLYCPNLTDKGLAHLQNLKQLKTLGLDGSQVTDDGLRHLRGLTQLRRLDLTRTDVTGSGLVHLQGVPTLRWIMLDSSPFQDQYLKNLLLIPALQSVGLGNTRVTPLGATSARFAQAGPDRRFAHLYRRDVLLQTLEWQLQDGEWKLNHNDVEAE